MLDVADDMVSIMQVTGDQTSVLEVVLAADTERSQLIREEKDLMKKLNREPPASSELAGLRGAACHKQREKGQDTIAELGAPHIFAPGLQGKGPCLHPAVSLLCMKQSCTQRYLQCMG